MYEYFAEKEIFFGKFAAMPLSVARAANQKKIIWDVGIINMT